MTEVYVYACVCVCFRASGFIQPCREKQTLLKEGERRWGGRGGLRLASHPLGRWGEAGVMMGEAEGERPCGMKDWHKRPTVQHKRPTVQHKRPTVQHKRPTVGERPCGMKDCHKRPTVQHKRPTMFHSTLRNEGLEVERRPLPMRSSCSQSAWSRALVAVNVMPVCERERARARARERETDRERERANVS